MSHVMLIERWDKHGNVSTYNLLIRATMETFREEQWREIVCGQRIARREKRKKFCQITSFCLLSLSLLLSSSRQFTITFIVFVIFIGANCFLVRLHLKLCENGQWNHYFIRIIWLRLCKRCQMMVSNIYTMSESIRPISHCLALSCQRAIKCPNTCSSSVECTERFAGLRVVVVGKH